MARNIKKTHPMVLVAATALTVFSLLGSAAITGLLPTVHTYRPDLAQELISDPNAAMVINSATQQRFNVTPQAPAIKTCNECGTIVSIRALEDDIANVYEIDRDRAQHAPKLGHATYIIKVKMDNGSLHTVTQNKAPRLTVGDLVKLKSGHLVNT